MTSQWQHFTIEELTCRCGCGNTLMDEPFMEKLVNLRRRVKFALPVTSGYRCPSHNHAVSETGLDGPHAQGKAVDIQISGELATILIREALNTGFLGMGIRQHGEHSQRIVHLDTVPRVCQIIWTY